MDDSFKDLHNTCCVFADGILIFRKTEEHLRGLEKLLLRCQEIVIILSEKNAVLVQTRIKYLGLEIQGLHMLQPHVLNNIQSFPNKIEDKKNYRDS